MKIPKPTDRDKQRFTELAPDAAGVEVKPMFGNLGAFVNGNMFMGLFGSDIGLKLPDDQREKLLAQPGSGPFGPEDRPMGGYATVPADWSKRKITPWIDRALTHAAALPPKSPKKRPAKKTAKSGHGLPAPTLSPSSTRGTVGHRWRRANAATRPGGRAGPRYPYPGPQRNHQPITPAMAWEQSP